MEAENNAVSDDLKRERDNGSTTLKEEGAEPALKKSKVEEESTSKPQHDDGREDNGRTYKQPRKCFAICLGYDGIGFSGMQLNPDVKTIEGALLKALLDLGYVHPEAVDKLGSIHWMRAARTDKGVHAAANLLSGRFDFGDDLKAVVSQIQEKMPNKIRIHGIHRTTKTFNAKNMCDRRRYEYVLPVFCLSRNSSTVLDELKRSIAERTERLSAMKEGDDAPPHYKMSLDVTPIMAEKTKTWESDKDATLERFREALQKYVGTHSYHNYTTCKGEMNKKQNERYIISFEASDPFSVEGCSDDFVRVTVVGQSFLLNQIRKMIGVAIQVAKGAQPLEYIDKTFEFEKMVVPRTPGEGLMLDAPMFCAYNRKFGNVHGPLDVDNYKESVEKLKAELIYPTVHSKAALFTRWVLSTEIRSAVMQDENHLGIVSGQLLRLTDSGSFLNVPQDVSFNWEADAEDAE